MSQNLTDAFWPKLDVEFGQIYLVFIHGFSMLIAIPGNFLITYTISKSRKLWGQPSFRCLISVSIADFFVGALGQPFLITMILKSGVAGSLLDCLSHTVTWSLCAASGFGVLIVTIERYLYFQYPLKYNLILTSEKTKFLILLQWILGIFFGSISLIYRNDKLWFTIVMFTLVLSNMVMIVVYFKVRRIMLKAQLLKISPGVPSVKNGFLFVIVMVFCGFWYPALIVFVTREFYITRNAILDASVYWSTTVGCLNSSFNVFIYGLGNRSMRQEIMRVLKRDFKVETLLSDWWNITYYRGHTFITSAKNGQFCESPLHPQK